MTLRRIIMLICTVIGSLAFVRSLPAYAEQFDCSSLTKNNYREAGLVDIKDLSVQLSGVCQAVYRDKQITISTIISDKIQQLQFTNEYRNHVMRKGNFDIVAVGSQEVPCTELIFNSPQIITVTADNCNITTRVVYEIIDHKL